MGGMTESKPVDTWFTDMDAVLVHEGEVVDSVAGLIEFVEVYNPAVG